MIGVDFDNTIVCHDGVFHELAVERGWVSADTPSSKTAVRDQLRADGREKDWIELQGAVYGPCLTRARPFPGALDFFSRCREEGVAAAIVSHRTRNPFRGPRHDLHEAAQEWTRRHGLTAEALAGGVHFELTKEAKRERIVAIGCRVFVDDLPEFLGDPDFPTGVERLLFDPADRHGDERRFLRMGSWNELSAHILSGQSS